MSSIQVTKTFLPPLNEYAHILQRAWDVNQVTNRGILVKELEAKIAERYDIPFIIATSNGTIALQIAIRALNLKGEIITTPFSYVATTSSIVWEHCTPVFVDIEDKYFSIDENKIEEAIGPNTSAILATHVFGNPCNVEVIDKIAAKHNLHVIYDAAHCFGVSYNGRSIFNYGHVSTCSFHATKVFHTAEGGAMFTASEELYKKLFYHHNFGHKGREEYHGLGINGKISEISAALGLAVWPYIDNIIDARKKITGIYSHLLKGINLQTLSLRPGTTWNYSYFPVVFQNEVQLKRAIDLLNDADIFPRRYFYPSLSGLDYIDKSSTPVSDRIASSIICLPLYHDLAIHDQERIVELVGKALS